jgi:hypothetical protein
LLQLLAEKNSFLYLPDRIKERRILREHTELPGFEYIQFSI